MIGKQEDEKRRIEYCQLTGRGPNRIVYDLLGYWRLLLFKNFQ